MNSKKNNDVRKFTFEQNLKTGFSPQNAHDILASYSNAAQSQLFDTLQRTEVQVQIRPDKSLAPAKFKPDLLHPGHYLAHPSTIKAMRKDLFLAGEDFVDLEQIVECKSCSEKLDLRFWQACPYCEQSI